MALNLALPEKQVDLKPRIVVLGVGGAGGNAVNTMIQSELQGVEFVVANTDAQALASSLATRQIQLGTEQTRGLGAGSKPEVGKLAAEESIDEVMEAIADANLVFVAAGMGGGTGTGAAPVIAKAARDRGILTVAVVTKPFRFEGAPRMRLAEKGIEELQSNVDTLITIPNQNLFRVANDRTTFAEAFKLADDVLYEGVRGISDLMVQPGLINLDFADVRALMSVMGKAMMGLGEGEGECRAIEAAEAAIANPLLEDGTMRGAMGVLINIAGGPDLTLFEVDEAANRIREEVDPEANIIFGSSFDPVLQGRIRISVVATGIDAEAVAAYQTPELSQKAPQETPVNASLPQSEVVAPTAPSSPMPAPRPVASQPISAQPVVPQEVVAQAATSNVAPSRPSAPVYPSAAADAAAHQMQPRVAPTPPQPPVAPSHVSNAPAQHQAFQQPIAPISSFEEANAITSASMQDIEAPEPQGQNGFQAVDATQKYANINAEPNMEAPRLTADQQTGQVSSANMNRTMPSNGSSNGFVRSNGLFSRIQNFAKNSQQPFGSNERGHEPYPEPQTESGSTASRGGMFTTRQTEQKAPFNAMEQTPYPTDDSVYGEPQNMSTPMHSGNLTAERHQPSFDEDLLEIPAFLRRQAN